MFFPPGGRLSSYPSSVSWIQIHDSPPECLGSSIESAQFKANIKISYLSKVKKFVRDLDFGDVHTCELTLAGKSHFLALGFLIKLLNDLKHSMVTGGIVIQLIQSRHWPKASTGVRKPVAHNTGVYGIQVAMMSLWSCRLFVLFFIIAARESEPCCYEYIAKRLSILVDSCAPLAQDASSAYLAVLPRWPSASEAAAALGYRRCSTPASAD